MAEEKITNISLSNKKCFSIDGDGNRLIYLDISDMNLIVRLEEVYQDLQKLAVDASERIASVPDAKDDGDLTPISSMTTILKDIDKQMREKVDYIFASEVSDICVPTGNMYDPVNGEFRFEHLIDVLTSLYASNYTAEFKKMQDRVKKHTAKYTKSSSSKRKK